LKRQREASVAARRQAGLGRLRTRAGDRCHRRAVATGCLIAWFSAGVFLGIMLAPAVSAQKRTELEEPGQVERRPVQEAPAEAGRSTRRRGLGSKSESKESSESKEGSDAEPERQPNEATTILPDSEAIDESIEQDDEPHPDEATSILPDSEAVDESIEQGDEAHPDEATTILPDSEAVDESIEAAKTPIEGGKAETKTSEPARRPDRQWSIRWQNAFIVERVDDPQYQFLFGGRIQNDWGIYAPDNDLENDFGGDGTGTKFRRARLYFQGQFFRHGFFKAEYDFANGSEGTEFSDVYMGLNLPKIGLIRVGYFKEPFSLEFQNSSNFISFNERSSSFAFTPARNSGIMMNGNFLIRDSTFAVAFMRRTDDLGEGFSNKEDYHLTARITGLPYFEDGGARLLHLEFGYSHQFADQDVGTRYDIGPANDFAPTLVDTGAALAVTDVDLFNFGLAVVEGSFSLQAEVTLSLPHGGISENPLFWGTYLELSWWLTGENRRYLRGRGVFSRVVPRGRFDPDKGQWGALEVATRYSWLDLSDHGIRGGTLGEWSLALNWVLFSNLRVSNNYVFSHTADREGFDSGVAHSWVTRFQIDF